MACYACEDCSNSIEYGGKCKRFEYDCPFEIVKQYDSEKLKLIRDATEKIFEDIIQLEILDCEHYMVDDIDNILSALSSLRCKINEGTEDEWNKIQ